MAPIPSIHTPNPETEDPEVTCTATTECLLAPSPVTDGVGRALVMYQRMIESGFDGAQVLVGA